MDKEPRIFGGKDDIKFWSDKPNQKNKPLTRQQINQFKRRFIWLVLFIAASLMLLFSCSPSLYRGTTNYKRVAWCTEDYVYVWKDYERTEIDSVRNVDNWMLSPDDFIICEYDYVGGLK